MPQSHKSNDKTTIRSNKTYARVLTNKNVNETPAGTSNKYEQACRKIQASLQKYIVDHDLKDDSNSDEDEQIVQSVEVIDKALSGYKKDELGRTRHFLEDSFQSDSVVCLICIETVKKVDPIWNCRQCYTSFHIHCVQKWAKDSLYIQSESLSDRAVDENMKWACPKCRCMYEKSEIPIRYFCFCLKKSDPKFDPWLFPHSCGEACGNALQPLCGHSCLLLCHPGPCPPCPKIINFSCYCGKQPTKSRRCSSKYWSCNLMCEKLLSCKQHYCTDQCHPNDCHPCLKRSEQQCICKSSICERNCAELYWQCDKVCGKQLPCGFHTCEKICHEGDCGDCPLSGPRKCPCGKTKYTLPCTENIPSCGDTCDKTRACGIHFCGERCHKGSCQICCIGNCPPCEQQCGRTLSCGQHKCESRCHRGRCYPCPLTFTISCHCSSTKITLPCGKQKTAKPPRCLELCRLKPKCHHAVNEPHKCHFGSCPPCKQPCNLIVECGHVCTAVCHDAVPVKVPVPNTCLGAHETVEWPCGDLKPYSCGQECGQLLTCTNHYCKFLCHIVKNKMGVGSNCQQCEEVCSKTRPDGCNHPCKAPCHPSECNPCDKKITISCHCGLIKLYISCWEFVTALADKKENIRSCTNQCIKYISCGHRCRKNCHSGSCSSVEECLKKVSLRCPCKRIKKEFICNKVLRGKITVDCDEICLSYKNEIENAKLAEIKKKEEEEEAQRLKDIQWLNRIKEGRRGKRRERRQTEENNNKSSFRIKILYTSSFVLILSVLYFYFFRG